jgi:hypothetical protein
MVLQNKLGFTLFGISMDHNTPERAKTNKQFFLVHHWSPDNNFDACYTTLERFSEVYVTSSEWIFWRNKQGL